MIYRLLLAVSFCACLLPFNAFCEADVVDGSENYALLEEQQTGYEPSVAHDNNDRDEEPALAKDDTDENANDGSLLNKIQGLQQEIQELRGQLDVQTHNLKLLQEQQLSFYKDLDARISNTPVNNVPKSTMAPTTNMSIGEPQTPATTTAATTTTPSAAPSSTTVTPITTVGHTNPADEQIAYLAAYDQIKNKHFDEGLQAMQEFVNKYPHGGYTANAEYWIGELYMVKNDYPQAINHFNVVLQEFPSSNKSAASLLKIGYALAASGRTQEAREKLQAVIKNYPDTAASRLASAKLNSLNNQ